VKKDILLIIALMTSVDVSVYAAGDFPMTIVNNTNNPAIKKIYILVKGNNPITRNQCCVAFRQDGSVGTYVDLTAGTDTKAYSYDYTFFKDGVMHLPNIESGRIYISINTPLTMPIVLDANKRYSTADPDPQNTTDPSYDVFFDKVEFTYMGNDTWTNPTAVDFFALPISIAQDGKTFGLTVARKQVIDTVTKAFNEAPDKSWLKLIVKNSQGTVLRILAPGRDNTTKFFDPNYLNQPSYSYIDDVWNYYRNNSIVIDCTELRNNPNAPRLGDYMFTGKVEGDNFIFTNNSKDHTVVLGNRSQDPTLSNSFFRGAQGVFEAQNNTPKAIIVRSLSAAWCVGLLPTENGAIVNRKYFLDRQGQFYKRNPRLSSQSLDKGPFYNLYGKAIHELSRSIYTWSYDDAFGYDGTNGSTASKPATLTIWDMSQTQIPN
jgi:hypothetical protein